MTLQLDTKQIREYEDSGFTVVRNLLDREETVPVRARLLDLYEGRHDWPPNHFQVLDPAKFSRENGQTIPIGVQQPAQREDVFRRVADHPRLIQAMEQLLGGPVKRYTDQALIKNPSIDGTTFYHQDSYYWRIEPRLGCNAWIALDPVGKGASALAMMPGTQADWTLTPHEAYYDEPSFCSAAGGKAFTRWRIPLDQVDFSREVLVPLEPGDAAFFTNYTWHRAEPNRSGRFICAYAIAYQRE